MWNRPERIADVLRVFLARLVDGGAVIGAVAAAVVMFLISADVMSRTFFDRPLEGVPEIATVMLVVVVYGAIAKAEAEWIHVRTDFFTGLMPNRLAKGLRTFGRLAMLVLVAWLAYATTERAMRSYSVGEFRAGVVDVPVWPARVAIAASLLLLLAVLIDRAVAGIFSSWRRHQRREAESVEPS